MITYANKTFISTSTLQHQVALSTMEAKNISLSIALGDVIPLMQLVALSWKHCCGLKSSTKFQIFLQCLCRWFRCFIACMNPKMRSHTKNINTCCLIFERSKWMLSVLKMRSLKCWLSFFIRICWSNVRNNFQSCKCSWWIHFQKQNYEWKISSSLGMQENVRLRTSYPSN